MTIEWYDDPPATTRFNNLPLRRVGPSNKIVGLITCPQIVGTFTHYIGGRTLPHTQTDCPGCTAGRRKAWEGYVSLWTTAPGTHILVALTAPAANDILDGAGDPKNLRGLHVVLERVKPKANAKLRATMSDQQFPGIRLPPIPDIRAHLWHIWGLDSSSISEDHPLYPAVVAGLIPKEASNGP